MSDRALKQLVGALFVVVALWGIASLFSRGGGDASIGPTGDMATFFDGVEESTLDRIRFLRPQDTIVLQPAGEDWVVNGWPSDSGNVARFFAALSELEVGGLAANNPANHRRMGVASDSALTLELEVGGGARSLLVGGQGPRSTTAYARLPGEDAVYLLEGNFRIHMTRALEDWRNRKMVAIDTSRVSRIAVERDGDSFALQRGDGAWTFEDGGETDGSQVESLLRELAGGLVASRFVEDDEPIGELPEGGSTIAYDEDGTVLAEVTIGSGEGDRWARVVGDSAVYRIASFRVNLIAPTLESLQPGS